MKFMLSVAATITLLSANISSCLAESKPWLGVYVVDISKADSKGVAGVPKPSFTFGEQNKLLITLNKRVMAEGTYTVDGLVVTIENSGKKKTGRFSKDYRYFGLDDGAEMAYVKEVE